MSGNRWQDLERLSVIIAWGQSRQRFIITYYLYYISYIILFVVFIYCINVNIQYTYFCLTIYLPTPTPTPYDLYTCSFLNPLQAQVLCPAWAPSRRIGVWSWGKDLGGISFWELEASLKLTWQVGILVSFWDGLFKGLFRFGVCNFPIFFGRGAI